MENRIINHIERGESKQKARNLTWEYLANYFQKTGNPGDGKVRSRNRKQGSRADRTGKAEECYKNAEVPTRQPGRTHERCYGNC